MKKLLLAALILASSQIKAQSDTSLILYRCFDNPISTTVAGTPSDNILVQITSGDATLTRSDDGNYTANPNSLDPIEIKISNKKTGKTLSTIPFRVAPLPEPTVTAGLPPRAQRTGEIDYKRGVWATIRLPQADLPCKVLSFSLRYTKPGQQPININNRGNIFSEMTRSAYANAKSGDTYTLYNIKAVCPCDKAIRELPSQTTTVN